MTSRSRLFTTRALTLLAALALPVALSGLADAAPVKKGAAKKSADAGAPTAAGPATAPADASPMAELKKSNAQLKKVLGKQTPTWSPENDVRSAEVRKIVGQFLDFEELARRSLARHWDGLTPKQREEFVSTLRQLVERSYVTQISQADYDLAFKDETKNGNEANVTATLHTKARGKKVDIALEYKTLWKNGRWVVYDVVTDDQSLLENYRAEFNKIINKESFDALLKRMKKRLQERPGAAAANPNEKPGPAAKTP